MDAATNGHRPVTEIDAPHCTDLGNAQRLVRAYGHRIRYVPHWHRFLVHDGVRWTVDEVGEVDRLAKAVVASLYDELLEYEDNPKARRAFAEHAVRSESEARIRAMIALARTERGVPVRPDDLDANPWLLAAENGVVDLRTGILRPHDPADLITQLAPVVYDPKAECPRWMKFLDRIFAGTGTLIEFMQRAIGYALTGDTSEQVVFILWGTGANGKSTLLTTLAAMLGTGQPRDYAVATRAETFMVKKGDSIPNDVAALHAARMVITTEAERDQRMAESLVKRVTGGEAVPARFMRAEYFSFTPQFKVFLATNHKPIVRGTDHGIWRRIRLIPFTVTIPPAEQDPYLAEALKAELPGILRWAVEGCLAWQAQRLGYPKEVREATEGYRRDMDVIGDFVTEKCFLEPTAEIIFADLYTAYTEWSRTGEDKPLSKTAFSLRLQERGLTQTRNKSARGWLGIRLRTTADPEPDLEKGDGFSPVTGCGGSGYFALHARAHMEPIGETGHNLSPVTNPSSEELPF